MDRRLFLSAPAGVTVLAPLLAVGVQAAETTAMPPINLVFTKDNTGIWEAKKNSHLPLIELSGNKVTVITPHEVSPTHFIVRHTLLLANGTVVGSITFKVTDIPKSEYMLPAGYKGRIYATSFCNQHDLWVSEASV